MEAVAGGQVVDGRAFAEAEVAGEDPELLVLEDVGVGRVRDGCAGWEFDLDEFEWAVGCGGDRAPTVASGRIGPDELIGGPAE